MKIRKMLSLKKTNLMLMIIISLLKITTFSSVLKAETSISSNSHFLISQSFDILDIYVDGNDKSIITIIPEKPSDFSIPDSKGKVWESYPIEPNIPENTESSGFSAGSIKNWEQYPSDPNIPENTGFEESTSPGFDQPVSDSGFDF